LGAAAVSAEKLGLSILDAPSPASELDRLLLEFEEGIKSAPPTPPPAQPAPAADGTTAYLRERARTIDELRMAHDAAIAEIRAEKEAHAKKLEAEHAARMRELDRRDDVVRAMAAVRNLSTEPLKQAGPSSVDVIHNMGPREFKEYLAAAARGEFK